MPPAGLNRSIISTSVNGALAQADVLGIFGRERLDLATLWAPPAAAEPGAFAFRIYLFVIAPGGSDATLTITKTGNGSGTATASTGTLVWTRSTMAPT